MKELPIIQGRGSQINTHNRFESQHYESSIYFEDEEFDPTLKTICIDVHPKTIINQVKSPDVPYPHSINPYQGCEHGCIYCYARETHNYWGYSAGLDFESKILVKRTAPTLLAKALQKKSWKASPIMMSGNTDCYQPIEQKLQITRQLLEVFHRFRHPVGIITKNAMVLRDLDILADLANENLVSVAISINGFDEKIRRFLEPRTSTYKMRFQAAQKLSEAGIPVHILTAPMIPGLNSHELPKLVEKAAEVGARDCSYIVVRLNGDIKILFTDWLEKFYPDRKDKILNQIAEIHGGTVEDRRFKTRMRGEGIWADLIKQQFTQAHKKHFGQVKPFHYNLELHNQYKTGQLSLF